LINFYRILQVDDFSGINDVKRSYRRLAKKYHPDASSDPETSELFNLVNTAYSTLSDPRTKLRHDNELRQALEYDRSRRDLDIDSEAIKAKQRQWAERQRRYETHTYALKDRAFPFKYRIAFALVCALWGLQLIYSHWFVNLETYSTWFLTAGITVFVGSSIFMLSSLFTYYRMRSIVENRPINYESISWSIFLGLFLAGPCLILGLNTIRKSYHLEKYGVVERAEITDVRYSRVIYTFSPNGDERITKSGILKDGHIFDLNQHWIMIKYSKADPRITRLVKKED